MKLKILKISLILTLTFFLISCGGNKMDTATFETNYGTFKIKLFIDQMPITTANFIKLAKEGFYNGTRSHRIIAGFMIQGGDPLTKDDSKKQLWGTGDPGYKIEDEFGAVGNNKGTIAMANSGPNSGGSQFFINLVNNNYLDTKHPVFGEVIEGMEIVEKIGNVNTGQGDIPVEDVTIKKVTIN